MGHSNAFPPDKFPRVVRLYDLLSATPTQPLDEIDAFSRHIHDIKIAPNGSLFAVDGLGLDQGKPQRRFHVYEVQPGGSCVPCRRTGLNFPAWVHFGPIAKSLAAPWKLMTGQMTLFDLPTSATAAY